MHATLQKFGAPATLVKELEHWCILRRQAQATLGALVLIAKSDATSLATLPSGAYAELQLATHFIETGLRNFRPFGKINYLALMMVDPHVHFHVLPRYAETQVFDGTAFTDPGWPALPDLKHATQYGADTARKLQQALVDAFNAAL